MTEKREESLIKAQLEGVRKRLREAERRYGRTPGSVGLVAVSKTRPAEDLRLAYQAGQRDFGENYLQEALEKMDRLDLPGLVWHFIGPLQSNKTRPVAERFDWVHTIDRIKLARRLSEQRPADKPPLNVCLQVNISGEASKSGITITGLEELAFATARLPRLRLRGLMAIPAPASDPEEQRAPFRALREALENLKASDLPLDTLSMGMTSDLEAAVAEGATLVRVGTAIFGPRAKKST
ncbi:MAG: YggS family pyridoxal phosphate-dependent enzyme [Gammaproteobacteria bacterium]